jgi:Dolichyl-phosphate-mannose-protein mannosyltransferase
MAHGLRPPRLSVAALGLVGVFLVCSLLQLNEYGQTIDESRHRLRGQFAEEYLRLALATWRIPTSQQVAELSSRLSAQDGGDLDLNHPLLFPLITTWCSRAARSLGLPLVPAAHLPLVLVASIGLWSLFLLVRLLFNERVAFFTTLLLVLFPPFLAHSQYNPKDTPVMSAVVVALYCCCKALDSERRRDAIVAGLLSAAAAGTKLDGLLIVPILGVSILAHEKRRQFRVGHFSIALVAGVFLFWPLLWTDPMLPWRALEHFSSDFHTHPELFFGKVTGPSDLPWFYIPLYLWFATPTVTLAFAIGGLGSLRGLRQEMTGAFPIVLILTWFLIPIGIRLAPNVLKYGGMRHVFVSVPPLLVLAALGLDRALAALRARVPEPRSWLVWMAPALVSVQLLTEVVRVHPFEGAYFNELARAALGPELQDQFDLDRWLASCTQGARWLNDHAGPGATVCAPVAPWLATNHAYRRDLRSVCGPHADYVLRPSTELEPESGFYQGVERDYVVVHRIRRMGSTILTVYGRGK